MEKTIRRPVGAIELRGIINRTIPICDEFGQFNHLGFAIIKKDGKVGLVNREPKIIIEPTADSIEFLNDKLLLVYRYGLYHLYTTKGEMATQITWLYEDKARAYALVM